ncbi:MAG TPA: bifunctional 5,10-methylenetetrahydrofolate dehydrogenase/5,10-methenyltetrahydrofolate cyclohydrolase [Vicinamibacterales bacterium]|nr:bifunctional 5,10-methylenetetrahydrofolate dehydrogenase/5,10-methenyltetrahydrofolate cyclohydrolase [Vicinamibacterales bacterium]
MGARIVEGAATAAAIRETLRPRIDVFRAAAGRPPSLRILLVGDDPASQVYVRNKVKSSSEQGLDVALERLDETASLADVLGVVGRWNADDRIDGILVQSPLPPALGKGSMHRVFDAIDPRKDVDGFHPVNAGLLAQQRPALVPCTPAGVIEMLKRERVPLSGARAVVIGRSEIVGRPMALLLLQHDVTVTICHSKTRDLPGVARSADILVAAMGRPAFVTPEFVMPGAAVVDVGVNRVSSEEQARAIFGEGSAKHDQFLRKGSVLVGDVHPRVADVAGLLTPVPGGVGPLTIVMLLANTIRAAEDRRRRG